MGLNPKSKQMEIGVRASRIISIFPMSMADEIKFTSVIADAFQKYKILNTKVPDWDSDDILKAMDNAERDNYVQQEAIIFVVSAIESNLLEILKMVCEEEVTLADITNEQFAELCELIYEMNFAGAVGKFMGLWKRIKNSFPQTKQSPKSSSQPRIKLKTSTDIVSSEEE
jgi:hypothetical protein